MTQALPKPGAILGDFEVRQQLGVGGFSVVYLARHRKLEREVAMKVLVPDATEDTKRLFGNFEREINIVRRLEHPNIVRLYDHGETEEGLPWMAMELVRGEDLGNLLARKGALTPWRAQRLILQVLSALAEAHRMSIVHRDLKPANIMLTCKGAERELVKLLDFGIAKALGESEDQDLHNLTKKQGGIFGTPAYMPPEQLRSEGVGPHTDVYSIGLILYEMIVGHPAFDGNSTYDVLLKQIQEPVTFPEWLIGHPLEAVIQRATEKNPEDRYRDAMAFYEALEAVPLHGDSTALTSQDLPIDLLEALEETTGFAITPIKQAPNNPRRRRLMVLVALALLVFIGVVVWALFSIGEKTGEASPSNLSAEEQTSTPPEDTPSNLASIQEPSHIVVERETTIVITIDEALTRGLRGGCAMGAVGLPRSKQKAKKPKETDPEEDRKDPKKPKKKLNPFGRVKPR